MSKTFLAGAGGLGVGLLLWMASSQENQRLRTQVEEWRFRADRAEEKAALTEHQRHNLEKALADLQSALDTTRAELDALRAASLPPAPSEPPAADDASRRFHDMVQQVGLDHIKSQMEAQLVTLKTRLNLTAEQERQWRARLEQQAKDIQAALNRLMSGQGKPEDFRTLVLWQQGRTTSDFTSLLTPEQQTNYAAYQAEERTRRIETKVKAELHGLQAAGSLTPEQQDEAFSRLSTLVAEEEATDWNALTDAAAIRAFMENAVQKRYAVLQDLLDDSQMSLYRQQVDAQMKLFSHVMPPP